MARSGQVLLQMSQMHLANTCQNYLSEVEESVTEKCVYSIRGLQAGSLNTWRVNNTSVYFVWWLLSSTTGWELN